jgi:hypothetical protein
MSGKQAKALRKYLNVTERVKFKDDSQWKYKSLDAKKRYKRIKNAFGLRWRDPLDSKKEKKDETTVS